MVTYKYNTFMSMYVVKFSTGGDELEKVAKNEQELWRLICTYTNVTQQEREQLFEQLKSEQHGDM